MHFNPDDWFAALDAAADRSNALPGVNRDADRRAMVQFLQTHPGFEAADVTPDGDIWALLKDGPLVALMDATRNIFQTADPDELVETPTGGGLFAPRPLSSLPARQAATAGPQDATGIPASPSMHFLLGPGINMQAFNEVIDGFKDELKTHGYDDPINGQATLAHLRAVKNVGVFYFCTHALKMSISDRRGKPTGKHVTLLCTHDAVPSRKTRTEERTNLLQSDIEQGRVMMMLVPFRSGKKEWFFAITEAFVEHHMTFALNSWVFINGCTTDDSMLRSAFLNKKAPLDTGNASLFVGWIGGVTEPAAFIAWAGLFSVLLGAKKISLCPDQQPKQRPFSFELAWEFTAKMVASVGETAQLVSIPGKRGKFRMLVPSIQRLEVAEQRNELRILGLFGQDPGESLRKVTINGTELRVTKWDEEEILCELDSSGDGTSGDVVVEVRKHRSNPRRLTEWQGTFVVWKSLFAAGMGTPSSLRAEAAFNMHWRTDAQSFRVKPCTAPVYPPQSEGNVQDAFLPMTDSTVSINAGGIDAYPDGSMRLWTLLGPTHLPHHTSTEPLLFNPKVPLGWIAKFSMDLRNKKMLVLLAAKVIDGVLYKQISGGGATSPPDRKEEFLIWTSPLGITGKPPWGMQVSLDDKCSVGKDTRTDKLGIWNGEWGKIEAKWPPDPEAAQ